MKLANRNLNGPECQINVKIHIYGFSPRISLLGIFIKDDIIVASCHVCLCLISLVITMSQTTLLAHHITTITEGPGENCTQGET